MVKGEGTIRDKDKKSIKERSHYLLHLKLILYPPDLPPLPQGPPQALQPLLGWRCSGGEPVQRGGEGLPQGAEVHAAERQRPHDGGRDQHGMRTLEGQAQTVEVNPFWSERVQREIQHSGHQAQVQADGGQGMPANGGLSHQDLVEIEAMKMQALREVRKKLKNEMARRRGAVASGNESEREQRFIPDGRWKWGGVSPSHPPGLAIGRLGFQLLERLIPVVGTPGMSVVVSGEALNESLRTLELPKLTECSALEFGDWMAVITPLMSDLNNTSATWWELTVNTAKGFYDQRGWPHGLFGGWTTS